MQIICILLSASGVVVLAVWLRLKKKFSVQSANLIFALGTALVCSGVVFYQL